MLVLTLNLENVIPWNGVSFSSSVPIKQYTLHLQK